jgi:hypothetical protein
MIMSSLYTKRIVLTCLLMMAIVHLHATIFEVDGIYYQVTSSQTVMVVAQGSKEGSSGFIFTDSYKGDVVIKDSVSYEGQRYCITAVADKVFANSNELTSITLPSTITHMGKAPFASCARLSSITVSAANPVYASDGAILYDKSFSKIISCGGAFQGVLRLPDSVISIGDSAFCRCTHLTSIILPSSVTEVGNHAFRMCTTLSNVILTSVEKIGNSAFYYCSSLRDIDLPASVSYIGYQAFYYCQRLNSVTSNAPVPPVVERDAFNNYSIRLYVPSGSEPTYTSANCWSRFMTIIPFFTGDVNNDGQVDVTDIMLIVGNILGDNPQDFFRSRADMDKNGIIDVTDVMLVVNVILDGHPVSSSHQSSISPRST